jgi:hypothetical protein
MGLFITFIFMFSGLAYASVLAAVPSVEDMVTDEGTSSEILDLEDTDENSVT